MSKLYRKALAIALLCLSVVGCADAQQPAVARVDTVRILLPVPGVCFVWAPDSLMVDRSGDPLVAATNADARIPCVPILVHRDRWASLHPTHGLFVLLHELAHIHLRHGFPPNGQPFTNDDLIKRDQEADCQAIMWFKSDWPNEVEKLLSQLDPFHLANVKRCL